MGLFKRKTAIAAVIFSVLCISFFYIEGFSFIIGGICIAFLVFFALKRKNNGLVLVLFFVVLIIISLLNTMLNIKNIEGYDGQTLTLNFTAVAGCKNFNSYNTVRAVTNENKTIKKGSKFEIAYFGDEKITAGDVFSADVEVSSLDGSNYKLYNYSEGQYASLTLKDNLNINGRN